MKDVGITHQIRSTSLIFPCAATTNLMWIILWVFMEARRCNNKFRLDVYFFNTITYFYKKCSLLLSWFIVLLFSKYKYLIAMHSSSAVSTYSHLMSKFEDDICLKLHNLLDGQCMGIFTKVLCKGRVVLVTWHLLRCVNIENAGHHWM